jgi:hypothetical protein
MSLARRFTVMAFCLASLCVAQGPALHTTRLSDGSGTIDVPPGWTVNAVNSMVSAAGPEGMVDLGINVPVYTPQAAAATPLRPPVVAPFGNPAADVQVMLGNFWHIAPQSIRILERSRVAWWTTGPGEMIHLTAPSVRAECLDMVLTGDTGFGTFMYYASGVCTSPDKFEDNLGLLLRIWASWKVNDAVYQSRLRDAACSLDSINKIIRGVTRRRQKAFDNANEAWDRLIRGER